MFFWGREDEDNRRQGNGQTLVYPTLSFWAYIKKFNIVIFWCMVIPLGPHSVYTYTKYDV